MSMINKISLSKSLFIYSLGKINNAHYQQAEEYQAFGYRLISCFHLKDFEGPPKKYGDWRVSSTPGPLWICPAGFQTFIVDTDLEILAADIAFFPDAYLVNMNGCRTRFPDLSRKIKSRNSIHNENHLENLDHANLYKDASS